MKTKSLCIVAMLLLCGCSKSGLDLASLSGKVTYQGKNLTHGRVVLIPTGETKGPMGVGQIKSDGTYTIITARKPGAIVGTHKVTVACRQAATEGDKQDSSSEFEVMTLLTPAQYTKVITTPLAVTVEPGGTTFNIDLLDKP